MRDGAVVHDAPIAEHDAPTRWSGGWSGASSARCSRSRTAEIGEPRADGRAPHARGRVLRRLLRGPRAARSSRSPGSSAPAAARSRARSSASTAPTPATSRSAGGGCRGGRPLAAMRAGLAFVPEDRRQQGLVMDLSIARNATLTRHAGARRALGLIRAGAENRLARDWAERLQLKFHRLERPGRVPLRRQPAEGRARQVARHRAEAADPRRADARHRRRHQGRGAPADERARRPRARRADDLLPSELPEVLGMADRVLVMHEGRLTPRALPRRGRRGERHPRGDRAWRPPHERPRRRRRREGARARRLTERVLRVRELGIVGALALLIAVTAILEPRFIETELAAQPRAQRLDLRDPRGRPDARDRHAQRRPLGRLGARAERVLRRRPAVQAPRASRCPLVFLLGMALGAACGLLNGVLVDVGPGARAGGHARHAVRVPRPRRSCGPTAARSTPRPAARRVPEPRQRLDRRRRRSSC